MKEGSLEAPTRHRIAWEDPDFTNRKKTEAEMRRIFDICHTVGDASICAKHSLDYLI